MPIKAGITTAVALFLLTTIGLGQSNRFDVSLGPAAIASKQSSGNGVVQTPTNSRGFLASLRLRLGPKGSLEVNYGRAKNDQKYSGPPLDYRVHSTVAEFTGAVLFSPFETKKLEPFVLGGAGVLVFTPQTTFVNSIEIPIGADRQTPVAFLYGGGADYRFYHRLAVRLQYRGLFYKAPDFKVRNLNTGAYGHLAEPSVGIVFKF